MLVSAADLWTPLVDRDHQLGRVADLCLEIAENPARRVAALRGLADSATTPEQLDALAEQATDVDLRWRRLCRLAELGRLEEGEVETLLADDPDPDAWMSAVRARAARPTPEAKAEAWATCVEERKIPPGNIFRTGRCFWRPGQEELLTPYAEKFAEALPGFGVNGMIWSLTLGRGFYPVVGGGEGYLDRLDAAAGADGVSPLVSSTVRDLSDRRRRRDAARGV
jgi:aminopeptidase N